jgi:hypothetical protein
MTLTNEKVIDSRARLSALPLDKIDRMCQALIEILKEYDATLFEKDALQALLDGNYDAAKQFCLCDPCSEYLAAISCLASAYRSPMIADSVLRDGSRHVAEVAKLTAEKRISQAFNQIICS